MHVLHQKNVKNTKNPILLKFNVLSNGEINTSKKGKENVLVYSLAIQKKKTNFLKVPLFTFIFSCMNKTC